MSTILVRVQDNIRALLSTLHTVLWESSGWNPPQMTDLVETGKVKKQYMKANLIIHPDKVLTKPSCTNPRSHTKAFALITKANRIIHPDKVRPATLHMGVCQPDKLSRA